MPELKINAGITKEYKNITQISYRYIKIQNS